MTVVATSDPDDLRRVFRQAVIDALGEKWDQARIDQMVAAYRDKEEGGVVIDTEPLLTPEMVAARLHVSRRTIYRWVAEGSGPRFFRAGKHRILYRWSDVERWLERGLDA